MSTPYSQLHQGSRLSEEQPFWTRSARSPHTQTLAHHAALIGGCGALHAEDHVAAVVCVQHGNLPFPMTKKGPERSLKSPLTPSTTTVGGPRASPGSTVSHGGHWAGSTLSGDPVGALSIGCRKPTAGSTSLMGPQPGHFRQHHPAETGPSRTRAETGDSSDMLMLRQSRCVPTARLGRLCFPCPARGVHSVSHSFTPAGTKSQRAPSLGIGAQVRERSTNSSGRNSSLG